MNKDKKKLGMGLGALLSANTKNTNNINKIDISKISPNKQQPRKNFEEQEIKELSNSIKNQGLIQPIVVREIENNEYEIIAGERRWRACQLAGLHSVECVVMSVSEESVYELALVENIQRQNLNVLEEAEAYYRLIDEFKYTQEKVARKIGKNRSTIANLLRLRNLPDIIKESLIAKEISMGHARALMGAGAHENQIHLFEIVRNKGLSVRKTEKLVNDIKKEPEKLQKKISAKERHFLDETSSLLTRQIKSKVKIKKSGDKGKIEINFKSKTEFQRLINLFSQLS